MSDYGKSFAGGATTANTELTLAPTGGWQVPPGSYNIYKAVVASANIANAKESSGFLIILLSNGRKYAFCFGGGTGGATNAGTHAADHIPMSIPISGGMTVTVSVLTAEVHNDTRVSLVYKDGGGPDCMTLACGGAGQDQTAGTELTLTANSTLAPITLTPYRDGKIVQIRATGAGIIDALAQGRRIILEIPGAPNQYEFVLFNGPGGAATAQGCAADALDLPNGIPVKKNSAITVKVLTTATTGGAILSSAVSLTCI